jgi:hypothetical protein
MGGEGEYREEVRVKGLEGLPKGGRWSEVT